VDCCGDGDVLSNAVWFAPLTCQREGNRRAGSPRKSTSPPIDQPPVPALPGNSRYRPQHPSNPDVFEDAEEVPASTSTNSLVFVESPNKRGVPIAPGTEDLLDDEPPPPAPQGMFAVNRVKSLPTPPVGPVLPNFDDLMVTRTMSRSPANEQEGVNSVRRMPSVVKKFGKRIAK